jgi:predicted nucleotidyltransferase
LPIEPGTEEGWLVVDAAVRSARSRMGAGLLSAYALGSLAHGGFSPSVSDVDVALLTDGSDGRDVLEIVAMIVADVGATGYALADRLSIFHAPWAAFRDPPPDARFPPIDRYDLVFFGILVDGTDLRSVHAVAPSSEEIRAQAVSFALDRVTGSRLAADLRELEDGGVTVHDATKIVLWPVRLQHVCDTGQAIGNAAAVDHYVGLPDARHRSLVRDALGWRSLASMPDPGAALRRILDEIHDLHAEVFRRLGERVDMPRRDELAARGRELAGE